MERLPVEQGQRFGRWTALDSKRVNGKVPCRCDCGVERGVLAPALIDGRSQSCGCLHREITSAGRFHLQHGYSDKPIHRTWLAMHRRCTNPNVKEYGNYGGRGIKVCDRWTGKGGFANFLADVGQKPDGLSLDRIDVNGNYEPGNVRWATSVQQANNKRPHSSLYRGVSHHKGKWHVSIHAYDKLWHLGIYSVEMDAARVAEAFRRVHRQEMPHNMDLDPIPSCKCQMCLNILLPQP